MSARPHVALVLEIYGEVHEVKPQGKGCATATAQRPVRMALASRRGPALAVEFQAELLNEHLPGVPEISDSRAWQPVAPPPRGMHLFGMFRSMTVVYGLRFEISCLRASASSSKFRGVGSFPSGRSCQLETSDDGFTSR